MTVAIILYKNADQEKKNTPRKNLYFLCNNFVLLTVANFAAYFMKASQMQYVS